MTKIDMSRIDRNQLRARIAMRYIPGAKAMLAELLDRGEVCDGVRLEDERFVAVPHPKMEALLDSWDAAIPADKIIG